jgi:hypothetical protein
MLNKNELSWQKIYVRILLDLAILNIPKLKRILHQTQFQNTPDLRWNTTEGQGSTGWSKQG